MYERTTCEEAEICAAEYLEDTLPPALHLRITAHLAECPECSEHLQRIRWTIDHLAALPRTPMPAGMKTRLLATIRSGFPPAA